MGASGDVEYDQWRSRLDEAIVSSSHWRSRLAAAAAFVPDFVLGAASAAADSGGYVPMASIHSARRARRRVQHGRTVSIDAWWTDGRLPPESVTVVVRPGHSLLRPSFAAPIDLGAAFSTVAFARPPTAGNDPVDKSVWLQLSGPAAPHYLSADLPGLMLIGMCAQWPYPPANDDG